MADDLLSFLKSADLEEFKAHFNRIGILRVDHLQDVDDLKEIGTATIIYSFCIYNLYLNVVFSTMKLCHLQVARHL